MKTIMPAFAAFVWIAVLAPAGAQGQTPELCGLYRAVVVETRDPAGLDRLLVAAPAITAGPAWAERVYMKKPFRAAQASAGDAVYLQFEGCSPTSPVIVGFARQR